MLFYQVHHSLLQHRKTFRVRRKIEVTAQNDRSVDSLEERTDYTRLFQPILGVYFTVTVYAVEVHDGVLRSVHCYRGVLYESRNSCQISWSKIVSPPIDKLLTIGIVRNIPSDKHCLANGLRRMGTGRVAGGIVEQWRKVAIVVIEDGTDFTENVCVVSICTLYRVSAFCW